MPSHETRITGASLLPAWELLSPNVPAACAAVSTPAAAHALRNCMQTGHFDFSAKIKRRAGSSTRAVSLQKKPPVSDTAQAVRNRGASSFILGSELALCRAVPTVRLHFKPQSPSGIPGILLFRRQRMPGRRLLPPAEKPTAPLQQGLHEMKPERPDHEHYDQNQEKRTDCSQRHGNHLTSWQSCSGRTV